jgi:NitT/TauT family transport system substrate-binding protein
MPSFGLFATESKLAAKRESIAKFASIVAASWQYIYNGHESEAVDAMVAQRPQAKLDKAILRAQIDALKGFFQLPVATGQLLGAPVEADFVIATKTLTDVGLIKTLKNGKDFFVPNLVRPTAGVPK